MAKNRVIPVTRPPLERITRIHRLIENSEYLNSKQLARELEVSFRTVKRDIMFMKERLNLPIQFDAARNGYYFSKPVPKFPQLPISERETFALFIASKAIEQYRGTPFHAMLHATFRKLSGQLDDSIRYSVGSLEQVLSFRPLAPAETEVKTFELLTQAVRERRAVKFMYRNRGQTKFKSRHVHPQHIACVDNQWCLFAWDCNRRGDRTFVLTRLKRLKITHERFTRSEKFDLNKVLSGSIGRFKGREDHEILLELDAWGADDVRGRQLHSSQILTEMPRGGLRVRLRLSSLEEIETLVLSMGTHATVIAPPDLRARVRRVAEEVVRRCDNFGISST
jgi:predicted DNA-binding transcriptional regulator YafY